MITVEVDASSFYDWAEKAVENVKMMTDVLKEIRVMIYNEVAPLTPLKDTYLQQSFMQYSEIVSDYPFFELKMKMTGIDNPKAKGWDYALLQHTENFNHPIQGIDHYLEVGLSEAEPLVMIKLETDYLTALGV